jgi:hypothetical protein
MGTPSKKQIEANRLNALKSTGPKTEAGKARSRRNGLRHGLASLVLVPDEDQATYDAAMARWKREAGPDNVVEEMLIRRAAVGSVQIDRIEKARQQTRQKAARDAVEQWERSMQARARRKAQDLAKDPSNVVDDLEASAFGCEWLIRQWQGLDAPLRVGKPWDQRTVGRAQLLLGLPEGSPGPVADPELRTLWILAAAWSPRTVAAPPRLNDLEDALPSEPEAALLALRDFIAFQIERLEALRDASWELVEGPDREAVALRAAAADTSKDAQLRHRYETSSERHCLASIRLFLNLRDRRRREHLDMAREAKDCHLLRAPVGGGWWREPDADPAPPGFERITLVDAPAPSPIPDPSTLSSPGLPADSPPGPFKAPVDPEPVPFPGSIADGPMIPSAAPLGPESASPSPTTNPEPLPIPSGILPEPNPASPEAPGDPTGVAHPGSPGAPSRSEPISPADRPGGLIPKPLRLFEIRDGGAPPPAAPIRRTEPRPTPSDPPSDGGQPPELAPNPTGTIAPGRSSGPAEAG